MAAAIGALLRWGWGPGASAAVEPSAPTSMQPRDQVVRTGGLQRRDRLPGRHDVDVGAPGEQQAGRRHPLWQADQSAVATSSAVGIGRPASSASTPSWRPSVAASYRSTWTPRSTEPGCSGSPARMPRASLSGVPAHDRPGASMVAPRPAPRPGRRRRRCWPPSAVARSGCSVSSRCRTSTSAARTAVRTATGSPECPGGHHGRPRAPLAAARGALGGNRQGHCVAFCPV